VADYRLAGPDEPVLTVAQVVAYLHLGSEATLKRLIAAGKFPRGHKQSAGLPPVWYGQDIAAYMHLMPRLREEADEKGSKKAGEENTEDFS
jgi:hypothetical protein